MTVQRSRKRTTARGRGRCGNVGSNLVRSCRSRRSRRSCRLRRRNWYWNDRGRLRPWRHRDYEARRILPMLVRDRIRDPEVDEHGACNDLGIHRTWYRTSRFAPIRCLTSPLQRIVGSTHRNSHRNGCGPSSPLVLEHALSAAAVAEGHSHRRHWVVCQCRATDGANGDRERDCTSAESPFHHVPFPSVSRLGAPRAARRPPRAFSVGRSDAGTSRD